MAFEFKLPDVGEGVVEGEIVRWLVKPGDPIAEDQLMVEIMTDKATVEIPSPRRGTISKTVGIAGDIIKVGSTLVVIEEEGDSAAGKEKKEPAAKTEQEPQPAQSKPAPVSEKTAETPKPRETATAARAKSEAPRPEEVSTPEQPAQAEAELQQTPNPGDRALASPATRKLARELGVDIEKVAATGSHGRVTSEDVRAATGQTAPAAVAQAVSPEPAPASGAEERIPLRGLRKRIAERMSKSKFTAPHFTLVDDVDVTDLVKLRAAAESKAADRGLKLSFLPFIIKGVVFGLKKFPSMNASLDDAREEIVVKKYYNIGIAVSTDNGLIVPVIKDADRKSIFELAAEIQHLAAAAREGKSKLEELQGGTFTITSLGALGGLLATPIINYPEAAILGVHKIEPRAVVRNGAVVAHDMMNLSISLDHRIVDGGVAAQFLQELKGYLEHPSLLFLDRL